MKYLEKKFTVGRPNDAYREGWDRIFGQTDAEPAPEERCGHCGLPLGGPAPEVLGGASGVHERDASYHSACFLHRQRVLDAPAE